jgi:hypothetical protein
MPRRFCSNSIEIERRIRDVRPPKWIAQNRWSSWGWCGRYERSRRWTGWSSDRCAHSIQFVLGVDFGFTLRSL